MTARRVPVWPRRQLPPGGLAAVAALSLALAAIAPAVRAAAPALEALMQRLAERRHGHAAFVERQYIKVLDRPLESSGELFYDAPDRLEKRTLLPKPASLLLDKGTLSMRRGKHNYLLDVRDYPQLAPFIDSIRATLAGDLAALERSYELRLAGGAAGWTLVLVPRDAALAVVVARIGIAGAGDQLGEITVERGDGDRSVMTITELPGS